jgi:glycosyltransferase involved in cell wall biosynthesis
VITIHDLSFLHYPGDYPPGLVEELSAVLDRQQRTVDLAICISTTTESDLLDRFRGFEGRTTVIHHGVGKEWFVSADEARIRKTLATLGIEPPYLLHIGALVPRKDLPTLVRAWMLLNEREHALALVLAGPDAVGWKSDLNAIRAVARDSAGPEPLHILGYVDDLAARHLMAAAAVYVCTSKCEGFGLPVLEAMAAGRPVVATRLSAVKEVAGDAIAYADVGDAEGLAAVIERVLRAPESGSEERARARASRFTWQRCAQQTLASYQHLLAS